MPYVHVAPPPKSALGCPPSSSRTPVQSIDSPPFPIEFLSHIVSSPNPRIQDYYKCNLGVRGQYSEDFRARWDHLGVILGGLGGHLGPLWGLNTKALNNTFLDDSAAGPHAHFLIIKHVFLKGFGKAVLDEHRKHRFYENAKVALAVCLCSENALQRQHQCKKVYRWQPEMLITLMKNTCFYDLEVA